MRGEAVFIRNHLAAKRGGGLPILACPLLTLRQSGSDAKKALEHKRPRAANTRIGVSGDFGAGIERG